MKGDRPTVVTGPNQPGPQLPGPRPAGPQFSRPRLAERALPRLHFVDGKCRVMLHDAETGDVIELGPREWVLLAGADGTRDLDGILLAASREKVQATREMLEELLRGAAEAGMLAEGPAPLKTRRGEPALNDAEANAQREPDTARDARPIERLDGYTFRCEGHGSCCQLYATIVFSPVEAARARALRPEVLDGGDRHEHAFMPERGTGPCAGAAVALVDGKCAYLEGALCSLHRIGGAASKPLGCNLFPLALVDDGRRVRASVSVECACVLTSVGRSDGDPVLPEKLRVRGDVDRAVVIDDLPEDVEVATGVHATRADYLRWNDAVLAALPDAGDAAHVSWALADAIEAHGLDVERALAAMAEPPPVDAALAARYLAALASKAGRRAKAQNVWRSERDLTRRGVSVIAAAASLLADADIFAAVAAGAGEARTSEAFYLRVALFGHQLVSYPLTTALRDRAVAMWIARTFPLAADTMYPEHGEPAFAHPLALVEALLRGHGLRRYVEDVGDVAPAAEAGAPAPAAAAPAPAAAPADKPPPRA